MNQDNKFPYKWYLKDGYPAKGIKSNGLKVFSTFSCGGGSTMGYKLAGYTVIGANDIDPQMSKIYIKNHNPKYFNLCPISDLMKIDLPKDYYNLDILDGSPPCSTFSMAGSREKGWKVDKKFREGQEKQVLSDLFFDFLNLAEKLKPKVIVAENVKGMLFGNAKIYTKNVMSKFSYIGYNCQLFCLNAATMGVPQKRERVFFIASKKGRNKNKLKLIFNDKLIYFKEIDERKTEIENKIADSLIPFWKVCKSGHLLRTVHPKKSFFSAVKLSDNRVCTTIVSGSHLLHPKYQRALNNSELQKISTFPLDYDFLNNKPQYVMGMSVPPVMMAQVANQIYEQWLGDK